MHFWVDYMFIIRVCVFMCVCVCVCVCGGGGGIATEELSYVDVVKKI